MKHLSLPRRARFLGLLPAATLAACAAVGPDYQPYVPPHPQTWSATTATTENASTLQRWWQSFEDPVLDTLVRLALRHNQDLAMARERLVQARAERDQVAAGLLPSIGAGADATAQRSATALDYPPGIGESRAYRLGLDASWEIDIFGGRRRALESADAYADAVSEDSHAVLQSLLAELANAYATLRATEARQHIAHAHVATLAETETLTERLLEHGLATGHEVSQARAERELGEARLPALQANATRLRHAIAVLAGGYPAALDDLLAPDAAPASQPQAPHLPAILPSEMLRQRPDIRAAERRLAAATADIGVATAERFPRFVIPLGLDTTASLVHQLFSHASLAWSAGVAASQSVYDGGHAEAAVRAAAARAEQARLGYEKSVRLAFKDVEDALVGLDAETRRQQSLRNAVSDSQDALAQATRRYRSGLATYLSVLSAQQSTYQAQDALALSQLAHTRHAIGLYKALGAGWQSIAEEMPATRPIAAMPGQQEAFPAGRLSVARQH